MKEYLFRILTYILCIMFLSYGVLVVFDKLMHKPFKWDSTFKVAVAALFWGVYLLAKCIKGK